MARWLPFLLAGKEYNIDHLNDMEVVYVQATQNNKPERIYKVKVEFSNHCFTSDKVGKPEYRYFAGNDGRYFDMKRYTLSLKLPEMIRELPERTCYFADHNQGNYMTCDYLLNDKVYSIYFKVIKLGKRLILIVQSAYINEDYVYSRRGKKISFFVVLHNTRLGKKIRRPK